MADHNDKKKKRIMHKLKLNEISAVDKPAQSPALAVIMKRADETIEKRMALVSMEVLHTHSITIDDWAIVHKGGNTGWVDDHDHPFVIEEDGSITIGAAQGHLHVIEKNVEEITKNGLTAKQMEFIKTTANDGNEDTTMNDVEKAAKKAKDEIAKLTKSLATATAIGTMNDSQRSMHAELTGDAADEFLAKSVEDREALVKAAVAKAADENAEVYTSHDGEVFTKADDIRMVNMAKKNDIMAAKLAKSAELVANADVSKRAGELFKNMTGKPETRTALLKAVEGIKDEAERKDVVEALTKSDAGISDILKEHGHQTVVAKAGSPEEANAKLEELAKAHVTANPTVNYYDAYNIVSVTPTGAELYKKAIA